MPFVVQKTGECPASKPFGVFTETAHGSGKTKGSPHGCFVSESAAREQQKALYANVPEAKSDAPSPPNLRVAEPTARERCATCKMYDSSKSVCWGYGNTKVRPSEVCDSYSAEPAKDASSAREESMTATAVPATPNVDEWRRERAEALSASQRKRIETREAHVPLELREGSSDGTRLLRSYASLFNEPYVIRSLGHSFEEVVRQGAFKRTLGTNPDVVFRTEHNGPPLAATWSGDLRLGEDKRGLWYEVDLDESDPDVRALISKVERGVYRESSFAFRIARGGDSWNDEHDKRELLACELDRGDVSVVTFGSSRGTGKHMLLRSEEAVRELQEVGFERFLEAWTEWRDFTTLPDEERVGKVISSQSMETLRKVISLLSDADEAIDEADGMLNNFLGVSTRVTGSEQLGHLTKGTRTEDESERAAPTMEDYGVMQALKEANLALAHAKAKQLADPDHQKDPDDAAVMTQIEAAQKAVEQAIVAQSKDGRRDDEDDDNDDRASTEDAPEDFWSVVRDLVNEAGWAIREDGSIFSYLGSEGEDEYWLREQDDVSEECRADLSTGGRDAMAKAGTAMPDGSYPIPNVAFLKKAIRAFGRATDKTAVKAWIKRRARALGATNLIPDAWRADAASLLPNDTEDLMFDFRLGGGR